MEALTIRCKRLGKPYPHVFPYLCTPLPLGPPTDTQFSIDIEHTSNNISSHPKVKRSEHQQPQITNRWLVVAGILSYTNYQLFITPIRTGPIQSKRLTLVSASIRPCSCGAPHESQQDQGNEKLAGHKTGT